MQFCGMMYRDHSDVYHFFIEGVEQNLLNGKVLIGYRWTGISVSMYQTISYLCIHD